MPIFGSNNGGTAVPCGQRLRFQWKSLLFMRACFPGGNISYLYDRYSRLLCKIGVNRCRLFRRPLRVRLVKYVEVGIVGRSFFVIMNGIPVGRLMIAYSDRNGGRPPLALLLLYF